MQRLIKQIFDFFTALLVLIVLFPFFAIIALLIKLDSKGTVFFRQERVGKGGGIFRMFKFRTMVENAENMGLGREVSAEDPRITKIGKFLRRFGIDELPQVINVVLGQMSLVGPRAALPFQFEKYTEFEKKRALVKPGITNINILKGWNALPWKKRIEWDIWYIEHWSLLLDLKILIKTPFMVLFGKGQYGKNGIVKDYE